ncbi:tail assembly protein [Erwinia typographi]|uniref:Tail assembly protein n=1 Tax=Erwinia typographi TaxID=371042 RepID=A0A0A3Z8Q2_9GAMM|nr:phage tail protein [Erwinia typographi]KGT95245.1 tail assembly protein [Erwinia typographi]
MMMTLGLFVFMLKTVPYQQLQYQRSWRFPTNSRVGVRPAMQFLGPDNDTVTLSGVLLPEMTGGRLTLFALEQVAELGRAWPLIEGSGTIYGMFVIESLSQTRAEFFSNGACRRIEFTLTLKRADESLGEMFGSLSDQLVAMKSAAAGAAGQMTSVIGGLLP